MCVDGSNELHEEETGDSEVETAACVTVARKELQLCRTDTGRMNPFLDGLLSQNFLVEGKNDVSEIQGQAGFW